MSQVSPLWFPDGTDSPGCAAAYTDFLPSRQLPPSLSGSPGGLQREDMGLYYKRWNDGHTDPNQIGTLLG